MSVVLPEAFGYQDYARDKVVVRRRTAVIAPPGAGKTRPIVEGVNELKGFATAVLIVCSGSAIATWKRQIPLWARSPEYADFIYVVSGNNPADRMALWSQAYNTNYGVYITNSNIFRRDFGVIQRVEWPTIIADEYHKFMRSHKKSLKGKQKTYGLFTKLTRHTPTLVLATGSLARRNASSMFTAFQTVDPFRWSSYWKFVSTYCYVDDAGFGQRVHGVKNAENLRKNMDLYFAYIPPEVVADALPEGRRYGIDVELTKEQKKVYKAIDDEMLAIVGDTIIIASTILAKLVKLRQLLCCPKILDESLGMGAGYEAIVDKLDQDDHVVIFVPFRPACDYVAQDLATKGYKDVFIMRGGVGHEEQAEICEKFRQTKGIMVCTVQYAESFDLETCKTSYFLGYDLTADQNEQAEGRTRRAISAHEFVTWGYIKTNTLVDHHFLDKLGEDARNVGLIMQRPESYIKMLREHKN